MKLKVITTPQIMNSRMPRLQCKDYGFECEFVAEGPEVAKVIEAYGKHSEEVHGIEYSKESLMQFILRQG